MTLNLNFKKRIESNFAIGENLTFFFKFRFKKKCRIFRIFRKFIFLSRRSILTYLKFKIDKRKKRKVKDVFEIEKYFHLKIFNLIKK